MKRLQRRVVHPRRERTGHGAEWQCGVDRDHRENRTREPAAEVPEPRHACREQQLVRLDLHITQDGRPDDRCRDHLSDHGQDQHGLCDRDRRVPEHGTDPGFFLDLVGDGGAKRHEEQHGEIEVRRRSPAEERQLHSQNRPEHGRLPYSAVVSAPIRWK